MPRRVSLPGAAELFRDTSSSAQEADPTTIDPTATDTAATAPSTDAGTPPATGRVRHDEKITVYVSSDELLALESARLQLHREYGLRVDRGRIVRAAIAMAMDDLAAAGSDADLLRRLSAP